MPCVNSEWAEVGYRYLCFLPRQYSFRLHWKKLFLARRFRAFFQSASACITLIFSFLVYWIVCTTSNREKLLGDYRPQLCILASCVTIYYRNLSALSTVGVHRPYGSYSKNDIKSADAVLCYRQSLIFSAFSLLRFRYRLKFQILGPSPGALLLQCLRIASSESNKYSWYTRQRIYTTCLWAFFRSLSSAMSKKATLY